MQTHESYESFSRVVTRSELLFIFEYAAAMANLEPVMECIAQLTTEMKVGAKQLSYLFVNTFRG